MSCLTFCRNLKDGLEATNGERYVSYLGLTNAVLHCTTRNKRPEIVESRNRFWSSQFDDNHDNDALRLFSNDTCRGPNYRVDTNNGRILSFCNQGNHIRAGGCSPADAVASMYEYYCHVLNQSNLKTACPSYPSAIVVPNVVSTGTFVDDVRPDIDANPLVSSSCKFPGKSITLSTRSTPMIYTRKCGKKKLGRNFIIPGLTTWQQARKSIVELENIVRMQPAPL